MKAVVSLALLCAFAALSLATTVGEFTCPAGQVEDTQCAAQCCQQAGGEYSFSDQTCVVDATAQWNAAMQCETQQDCCTSAGSTGGTPSSGCCGSGFVVLGALLGFAAFRH